MNYGVEISVCPAQKMEMLYPSIFFDTFKICFSHTMKHGFTLLLLPQSICIPTQVCSQGRGGGGLTRLKHPLCSGVVLVKCLNWRFSLGSGGGGGPHEMLKFEMSTPFWASPGYMYVPVTCTSLGRLHETDGKSFIH